MSLMNNKVGRREVRKRFRLFSFPYLYSIISFVLPWQEQAEVQAREYSRVKLLEPPGPSRKNHPSRRRKLRRRNPADPLVSGLLRQQILLQVRRSRKRTLASRVHQRQKQMTIRRLLPRKSRQNRPQLRSPDQKRPKQQICNPRSSKHTVNMQTNLPSQTSFIQHPTNAV